MDSESDTLLEEACKKGDLESVKLLINSVDSIELALHDAIDANQVSVVEYLLLDPRVYQGAMLEVAFFKAYLCDYDDIANLFMSNAKIVDRFANSPLGIMNYYLTLAREKHQKDETLENVNLF